jgi:hypothetical protein
VGSENIGTSSTLISPVHLALDSVHKFLYIRHAAGLYSSSAYDPTSAALVAPGSGPFTLAGGAPASELVPASSGDFLFLSLSSGGIHSIALTNGSMSNASNAGSASADDLAVAPGDRWVVSAENTTNGSIVTYRVGNGATLTPTDVKGLSGSAESVVTF